MAGSRLCVKNTFLDVYPEEVDGRRPRAQTDITDSRVPRKVSYKLEGPSSCQTTCLDMPKPQMVPEDYGYAFPGFNPLPFGFPGMQMNGLTPREPFPNGFGGTTFSGFPGAPFFPYFPNLPFAHLQGALWPHPPSECSAMPGFAQGTQQTGQPKQGRERRKGEKDSKRRECATANSGKGRGDGVPLGPGHPAQTTGGPKAEVSIKSGVAVEGCSVHSKQLTTVMLRNIPNRYSQNLLLSLLDEHGYSGKYDFVYLPMDFRNGVNLGYAFVNLPSTEDAVGLTQTFQGFSNWYFDSAKVCEVSWAHPHQGLDEHVERYRNSPVMHSSMPDEYKPMIFKRGKRVLFPPPTKTIRAPKLRLVHERSMAPAPEGVVAS